MRGNIGGRSLARRARSTLRSLISPRGSAVRSSRRGTRECRSTRARCGSGWRSRSQSAGCLCRTCFRSSARVSRRSCRLDGWGLSGLRHRRGSSQRCDCARVGDGRRSERGPVDAFSGRDRARAGRARLGPICSSCRRAERPSRAARRVPTSSASRWPATTSAARSRSTSIAPEYVVCRRSPFTAAPSSTSPT